jgi:hypothetical protein
MTRQEWYPLTHPRVPKGSYEITHDGRVRNASTKHILTNSKARGGYTQVCLTVARCKTLSIKTHRLVAETFLPNLDNLPDINHKDEDKTNNHINNLEWCTEHYNNHYSKSDYYKSLLCTGVGGCYRFTNEDIEDMKMFKSAGIKQKDIARVYGTSASYVCNLTRGNIERAYATN